MKASYIYLLIDPRNNEVRYVGQSIDPERRWRGHCCKRKPREGWQSKYANWGLINWTRELHKAGYNPTLMPIQRVPYTYRIEAEEFYIEYFKYIGASLFNRVSLIPMRFRQRKLNTRKTLDTQHLDDYNSFDCTDNAI